MSAAGLFLPRDPQFMATAAAQVNQTRLSCCFLSFVALVMNYLLTAAAAVYIRFYEGCSPRLQS